MGASANFGNMFSMAGAALPPFLPMLPVQILPNNLLHDRSELAIALDRVDADYLRHPRQWDMTVIRSGFFFRCENGLRPAQMMAQCVITFKNIAWPAACRVHLIQIESRRAWESRIDLPSMK